MWKLKAEKGSFSVRLDSDLKVGNIKNAVVLRDFLQKSKLST